MRVAVVQFFDENQKWLAKLLMEGKADATLTYGGRAEDVAQGILSALEGAMLVARPYGDTGRFDTAAKQLVTSLTP